MRQSSYKSIHEMIANESIYPDSIVIKMHDCYYPSMRSASKREHMSPSYVKRHSIVVPREEIKRELLSKILINL